MTEFNLDGLKMTVVKTAASGVVNRQTVFTFRQIGDIVSAHYAGGGVELGYLIGRIGGDQLAFRYCQTDQSGKLVGGRSECCLEHNENGRLRLIERFVWESRNEAGENFFEEIDAT